MTIVNEAKFEEANLYLSKQNLNKGQIKVYFTRKNKIKNILENTSSSTIKLDDTILNFSKSDKIIL